MDHSDRTQCRYHQRNRARWQCSACDLSLCTDCKPLAERLPHDALCPLCRSSMADLEVGAPFWRKWQDLLRYPAEPGSLIVAGVLSLIILLTPAGLVTLFVGLPLLVVFLYWSSVVFHCTACGYNAPPDPSTLFNKNQLDDSMDFSKIGLVYAAAIFAGYMSGSGVILAVILLLASMAFPASIMAMAIDEDFSPAFDYRRLSEVARRLGSDYNWLAAATLLIAAAPAIFMYLPGLILPGFIHAGLLTLLYAYGGLVLAHTIGSVLYQHRRVLKFAAGIEKIDRPTPPKPAVYEPIQALADARVQLAEGKGDHARMTIGEALTQYPRNSELNRRFEGLLKDSGNLTELQNHLERVLRRKVADKDVPGAVDHWLLHRQTLGKWLPRVSRTRHRMALELESRGDHRTAVRLLLTLPKTDRRYPQLPEACLEAARMLEEHFNDTASAEPLRKFVRNRYPERAAEWFEQQAMQQPG